MSEDGIVLTVGSIYKIKSLESKEKPLLTHGIFKGYTAIGHDDGICIKLDDSHKELAGKIRVIPAHMVLSIDIIKVEKKEEENEGEDSTFRSYG